MKFKGYTVNYQHRGKLPLEQKSQWIVDEKEEQRLFELARTNNWYCDKKYLWSVNEQFCVLGKDRYGYLYLAKYWSNQDYWHGFPVSPRRDGDRPPSHALKKWVGLQYIRKSIASKIAQGRF